MAYWKNFLYSRYNFEIKCFLTDEKVTRGNKNVVQQKDDENSINLTYEQQGKQK